MPSKKVNYCQKPDIDCPKIKCGAPLPCLRHLDVIFRDGKTVFLTPIHGEKRRRVIEVGKALQKRETHAK